MPTLRTLRGRAWKDSSHAFRVDVKRQECQWHSARVSPLVREAERFVDQRAGCLGLQLTFNCVRATARDDVIERRARSMVRRVGCHLRRKADSRQVEVVTAGLQRGKRCCGSIKLLHDGGW